MAARKRKPAAPAAAPAERRQGMQVIIRATEAEREELRAAAHRDGHSVQSWALGALLRLARGQR